MTDRDKAADLRLQRTYGITLSEYNKVLKAQGNACGICKKEHIAGKPRLAVDHDHVTGELRGLLCWGCNRKLGVFLDDVGHLEAAYYYAKNPPLRKVLGRLFSAPGRVGSKKRAKLLKRMGTNVRHESD